MLHYFMLVTGGFGDDGEVVDTGGEGGEVDAARGEGCGQRLAEWMMIFFTLRFMET